MNLLMRDTWALPRLVLASTRSGEALLRTIDGFAHNYYYSCLFWAPESLTRGLLGVFPRISAKRRGRLISPSPKRQDQL